jgi:hypothetical protein
VGRGIVAEGAIFPAVRDGTARDFGDDLVSLAADFRGT